MTAAHRRIPMRELEGILAEAFEDIVSTRDPSDPKKRLNRGAVVRVIIDGRSALDHPRRFPQDLFLKALAEHCGIRSCGASVIMNYGLKGMDRPLVEFYDQIMTSGSGHKLRQQLTKTNTRIDS